MPLQQSTTAATLFACPCGRLGGTYCAERIGLTSKVVANERNATFACRTRGKARLRMHAARLKPHVNIPARLTEERFFPRQNASRYHWYIAGRAVCQETYAEVCALGESSIQCIRKLALAAAEQDLDLTEDITPMSDGDVRRGEIDQRSMDVKSFLEDFAQDCCEAIPDGGTVGRLSTDALYDDLDVQHADDDGGTEWRLPFRSCRVVWQSYCKFVMNPYSYVRFLVKWHMHCRHVKRASKGKSGFCQCDFCLGFKRELMSTTTSQARRREVQRESEKHNTLQMAQRGRYAHHIGKAMRALNDARVRDEARMAALNEAPPREDMSDDDDGANARSVPAPLPTVPEVVSVTLDCASSQKAGTLPSFGARPPKGFSERTKLVSKAMGVIVHGIWRAMLLFPMSCDHGANMTAEAIDRTLQHLNQMYGCVPPVVYIQLDNCSDNKCKTVLAYLFDLRRRGILRKCGLNMKRNHQR